MTKDNLNWQLQHTYQTLPAKFYHETKRAEFTEPKVLLFNQALVDELGLGRVVDVQSLASVLVGNHFPDGAKPIAQAYAGHQFGQFTMLGDGRATLLGEQKTPSGELIDIVLKGNGRTVYSRRGDGRATLAPMLREYLMSETMHALGIATTRSLAVATTGEQVYRGGLETGAVLTRTAGSHLRVATFSFAAHFGDVSDIRALADYTIARHFIDVVSDDNPYLASFKQIIARQARLIASWQLVGFIHGVMNTDNMSIGGETIDYGPCAFMDGYDPKTVFSSIDHQGRYRYENQPAIAVWNLARLAEAMLPLFDDESDRAVELASQALGEFMPLFEQNYLTGMADKLGLAADTDMAVVKVLSDELLDLMHQHHADFTNSFVRLTLLIEGKDGSHLQGTQDLFDTPAFAIWQDKWQALLADKPKAISRMQSANPFIIARNYWVEQALAQAQAGDMRAFERLLTALQTPFDYTADVSAYQAVENMGGYRTFCGT